MTNLALFAESGECFYRRLEGHSVIGSVQPMNVDRIQALTFQTSFERFGEMFWAGVMGPLSGTRTLPAALGRDHSSSRIGIERPRSTLPMCRDRRTPLHRSDLLRAQSFVEGLRAPLFYLQVDAYTRACDAHGTIAHSVDREVLPKGECTGGCC